MIMSSVPHFYETHTHTHTLYCPVDENKSRLLFILKLENNVVHKKIKLVLEPLYIYIYLHYGNLHFVPIFFMTIFTLKYSLP